MNGEAVYRRIAAGLRQQITTGALPPGAPVPGVTALATEHGVTRVTARNALRLLEQEGQITGGRVAHHDRITVTITRSGNGWAGEAPTAGADSWGAAVEAVGRVPSQRIEVLMARADGEVAQRLNVHPGQVVIVRRLIRHVDGEPHNMITFWFPAHIAVEADCPIAGPESIAEGSIAWLERQLGPLSHTVEWSARMPAPDETEILRIPGGVPVDEMWRASTAGGRPVAVSRAVYPGDRTTLALAL